MAYGSVNVPGDLSGKQNKLTGLPGQAVSFDSAGNAAAVQGWSNRNLLRDWYFLAPINQRGKTEYTDAGYTIDGWKLAKNGTASVKIDQNGVTITKIDGTYADIRQQLEPEIYDIAITEGLLFSALINGELYTLKTASTSSSFPGGLMYCIENAVFIRPTVNNSPVTIAAVKLERGTVQTLAHKEGDTWVLNDPPPDPALELIKCQRYFECNDRNAPRNTYIGNCSIPVTVDVPIYFQAEKRITPACKVLTRTNNDGVPSPSLYLPNNGTWITPKEVMVLNRQGTHGFQVRMQFAEDSGIALGESYFVVVDWTADAEL